MKMLAAGCAKEPADFWGLMEAVGRYDAVFAKAVLDGVRIFDEHNTRDDHSEVVTRLGETDARGDPPIRVLDERTRRRSVEPAGAGLVVFNLVARRIIQVQNSYAELESKGRGRLRENGRPVQRLYHYALPATWTILP